MEFRRLLIFPNSPGLTELAENCRLFCFGPQIIQLAGRVKSTPALSLTVILRRIGGFGGNTRQFAFVALLLGH